MCQLSAECLPKNTDDIYSIYYFEVDGLNHDHSYVFFNEVKRIERDFKQILFARVEISPGDPSQ